MKKQVNKYRKTAVLENWFGIDRILFRNESPKKILGEAAFQQYLKNKAAMLMNLYEIYSELSYTPNRKYKSKKQLVEVSLKHGDVCLKNSIKFIKENMKNEELQEEWIKLSESAGVHTDIAKRHVIKKRILAVALDGFMLESAIHNVACKSCMQKQRFNILIDAHNKLRDRLIESVTN